ncbi:MAG: outer membrane protein assembly factor BamB [Magnetococcales bacterium]|nr:outer membrane protein assembly factor BamB [Magnetococcales bacterium]MBF0323061.1 outer membrane protein assembly factor BamB [Magnetococcales bacterium]
MCRKSSSFLSWSQVLVGLGLSLALGGCSKSGAWFNGPEKPVDETVQEYVEPKPGKSVGLDRLWRRGVASSPDKFLLHPTGMALDDTLLAVGTFQGRVVAMNPADGSVYWKADLGAAIGGGVAADAERVYAGTTQAEMVALDRRDGRELWRASVATAVASPPRVVRDLVIFVTLDNRTYALDGATGQRRWVHNTSPEPLVIMGAGTPSVLRGTVLVGYASGELFALSLEDGKPQWTYNMTIMGSRSELDLLQNVTAPLLVTPRAVFAATHQGRLMALQPNSGKPFWERAMSVIHTPLLVDDRLVVADVDGSLSVLSAADGVPFWQTHLSDALLTAPVMFHDRIIVGDSKGRIFAVDPASGRVVGLDHFGDPMFADPLVVGGHLYLWTNEGNVYRFQ